MDEEHPELRTYAQSQGWWTGEDEFNFAQVFSPADDHLDCCAGKDSLEKQEGKLICSELWRGDTEEEGHGGGVENKPCMLNGYLGLLPGDRSKETACTWLHAAATLVGTWKGCLFLLMANTAVLMGSFVILESPLELQKLGRTLLLLLSLQDKPSTHFGILSLGLSTTFFHELLHWAVELSSLYNLFGAYSSATTHY